MFSNRRGNSYQKDQAAYQDGFANVEEPLVQGVLPWATSIISFGPILFDIEDVIDIEHISKELAPRLTRPTGRSFKGRKSPGSFACIPLLSRLQPMSGVSS